MTGCNALPTQGRNHCDVATFPDVVDERQMKPAVSSSRVSTTSAFVIRAGGGAKKKGTRRVMPLTGHFLYRHCPR